LYGFGRDNRRHCGCPKKLPLLPLPFERQIAGHKTPGAGLCGRTDVNGYTAEINQPWQHTDGMIGVI
ncbi:MAG: hypothetical protein KDJ99_31945, partial [Candidatus Competibacteraceae bacterium]|nr:hypothetical protein [Candidatus Competibacteraceae bacterium]